ncbi:hypothetical protein ACMHYJ_09095 [Castellaniella hirudinis]|uniref:hypothetical protein n=1 Tax=Castellaniella hirudinis TaxID=1144617 RepID=UPI0039C3F4F5
MDSNKTAFLLTDPLADQVSAQDQAQGALLAQNLFTQVFREATQGKTLSPAIQSQLEAALGWVHRAGDLDAQAARLELLLMGLDQWGLAFSQAFQITAMPGLSALISQLRTGLSPQAEARFLQKFEQTQTQPGSGIDFKINLRRQIHLALWHAMGSAATADEAQPILQALGSQLLALNRQMPDLGWRLVADALAHMQIRLLRDAQASGQSQAGTQQLLAALRQAMPLDDYQRIMAHATQALLAWQRHPRQTEPS